MDTANHPQDSSCHGLVPVPASVPAAVLAGSPLAARGLSELAEAGSSVERLPPAPVTLLGHAAVSDEALERVLVVGGHGNASLWAFCFRDWAWHEIPTVGGPEPLLHASTAFDTRRRRLVCFGGTGLHVPSRDRLVVLDVDEDPPVKWKNVARSDSWPGSRHGASLTIDPYRDQAILFGGDAGGWTSQTNLAHDLWSLRLESLTWQRLDPTCSSLMLARCLHQAEFDHDRGRVVVFGGQSGDKALVLVVEVHPEQRNWLAPKGLLQTGIAMGYAPEFGGIVGVGGGRCDSESDGTPLSLWSYSLGTFEFSHAHLAPNTELQPRRYHATCYCRHRRALFCVGGWPTDHRVRGDSAYFGQKDTYLIRLDALSRTGKAARMPESGPFDESDTQAPGGASACWRALPEPPDRWQDSHRRS